jgi:MFS family permease
MIQAKKLLNDSALMRWSALLLISVVMFSSYYFYDVYSGIKTALQAETGLSNSDYGTMYGAYSFANAFLLMALFGGVILDKWGIRKTGTLFISFLTIGIILTAYGASYIFKDSSVYTFFNSFLSNYSAELKMMILGRVLFGLGAETFYVVINKVIAKWFKGKELALAFSISLAFGRFGTAAVFMLSPRLIDDGARFSNAGWFGVMLALIGFIAFFVYMVFDIKFDKIAGGQTSDDEEPEVFKLKDFVLLLKNKSFIYITLLCILFYSAVFPFLAFAADFLQNKFGFSEQLAGDVTTILPYGTIIFTPLFGWFTDFKGKNASVMIIGSILLIAVHLTFSLTSFSPYIPLFVLGVAFSLVPAAMWPSVARIVDENKLGTAYGFMFTVQNFGLMAIPIIMGKVLDASNVGITPQMVKDGVARYDYKYTILMLAVIGLFGVLFAVLLKREDKVSGYGLELPNKSEEKK